jgi:hypothetical protein
MGGVFYDLELSGISSDATGQAYRADVSRGMAVNKEWFATAGCYQ